MEEQDERLRCREAQSEYVRTHYQHLLDPAAVDGVFDVRKALLNDTGRAQDFAIETIAAMKDVYRQTVQVHNDSMVTAGERESLRVAGQARREFWSRGGGVGST